MGYPGSKISKWRQENAQFREATNLLRAGGQVAWNLGNMATFGQLGMAMSGGRLAASAITPALKLFTPSGALGAATGLVGLGEDM